MIHTADSKRERKGKAEEPSPRYLKVSQPANLILTILFAILALCSILPTVLCLIVSISSEASIAKVGYSFLPIEFSAKAYTYLWEQRAVIGLAFGVSILLTITGTVIGLLFNTTMGYVLSRPTYKLRRFFTVFILIPMLFSGGMVASYMVNTQFMRLKNTLWALILPLATSSWYIIILRTFFQTGVPDSVVESAKIDGAAQLRIFFQIVLPISLPAIATIGLFLTFGYWNDWFQALLYVDSNHKNLFPLQYVLVSIQKNIEFLSQNPLLAGGVDNFFKNVPSETMRMAIVMVIVLPIACAYPFFQRYFITGLTIGAVKG